jgi:hypothetical protein
MKKILILQFLLISLIIASCTKEKIISNEQPNPSSIQQLSTNKHYSLELTQKDKDDIERLFPEFKFKTRQEAIFSNSDFSSKEDLIKYLQSFKLSLVNIFSTAKFTVEAVYSDIAPNSAPAPGDTVTLQTVTVTGIASGGLFSSFTLTFQYSSGAAGGGGRISNQSLSLVGGTVGWWWNSGYSSSSGNSGYTNGTATYFYGLGTWSSPLYS